MGKYDAYIDSWRRRLASRREERQAHIQQLRAAAGECARFLGSQSGASRVYLFGSLVRDSAPFHEASDIDLAVEGLASEAYMTALTRVWELVPPGVQVDLVPLESASPELRKRVLEEGRLLYERE